MYIAYHPALPEHSKIHNVFHCSLLKPHHGPIQEVSAPLPPQATDNHPLLSLSLSLSLGVVNLLLAVSLFHAATDLDELSGDFQEEVVPGSLSTRAALRICVSSFFN